MKKVILASTCIALLASCLMGCSTQQHPPAGNSDVNPISADVSTSTAVAHFSGGDRSGSVAAYRKEAFKLYEAFGMTYNEAKDELSYNGKLVRWFEDYYSMGDNAQGGRDFFNENGVVDVYAVRDLSSFVTAPDGSIDPSGKLTDLKEFTKEEFEKRNVDEIKNPPSRSVIAGDLPSASDMEKLASEYKDFGVTYDAKTSQWFFNGEKVRFFRDIMTTNGESLTSGKFKGTTRTLVSESGTIDIYTIRDFNKPLADGSGTLTDVKKYSQQEFDEHTQDGKSSSTGGEAVIIAGIN